ncbi:MULTISPECIES: hypothetical protein [unclassified Bradyrhizobium]|uniref:hypothetical protein n=1 Tax=unclassified Bradyrhizobium TaxID=2631580 RepID=UPI002305F4DB|nr:MULTISPECIES: hypothetical protein [unclassified Bradyrhizobium]MDA9409432.1 hypothetical protein [Bradyrhizobium sp. CCBAU 45384]MDA9443414.1 hypothetical protein [Bradyrhizobium sp. CCBAU 51745]
MRFFACAASIFFCVTSASAEDRMTIDFSFNGTKGCVSLYPNPEIRITHAPPGTRKVLLRLIGPKNRELGGQETELPANGIVPAGSIRTFAPCNQGFYTYQAIVKAKDGATIATAEMPRFFPFE